MTKTTREQIGESVLIADSQNATEAERILVAALRAAEERERQAFDMLDYHGVSEERARSVANGIDVLWSRLTARIRAEIEQLESTRAENQRLREALEKIRDDGWRFARIEQFVEIAQAALSQEDT